MLEVSKLYDATSYLLKYSVVIFDLDDTLYSEKEYIKSGYAEIARNFKQIDDMENKLWNAFKDEKPAINYVLEQEGLFSNDALNFCLNIYRNHIPQISLYPDAEKMLASLKKQGISLGMITDGRPEGQRAKIKALGIEHFFDKIIVTDELGGIEFRKPNTIAFEKMQKHFNVLYEAMVYLGDNPKKDFIAPKLLGMNSIYFKNPDGLYSNN
ncbi:MAG: HAD family hydrolase [Ruminococcaceae bacterium]|nr:HAD family hydrolase [Oscillospiraceae bacterium]